MSFKKDNVLYLHISSNDSKSIYQANNYLDFIVNLPAMIELQSEKDQYWSMTLSEFNIYGPVNFNEGLVICCDRIESSCIRGEFKQVLAVVPPSTLVGNSFYLPMPQELRSLLLDKIRIWVLDRNLDKYPLSALSNQIEFTATLHVQKEYK